MTWQLRVKLDGTVRLGVATLAGFNSFFFASKLLQFSITPTIVGPTSASGVVLGVLRANKLPTSGFLLTRVTPPVSHAASHGHAVAASSGTHSPPETPDRSPLLHAPPCRVTVDQTSFSAERAQGGASGIFPRG